jgi:uncharacterized membrane protein YedE/YeeE
VVSRSTEARGAAEDVFHEMRRGVSAAEGGAEMRFLWFTAGFLIGVVSTTLAMLWMMALAVVA